MLTKRFAAYALIASWLRCESGSAAAEYALILAIVGASIAAAAFTLGTTITGAIHDSGLLVTTP